MWWKKNKAEVCGYLDEDGKFFQNKKDRDLSNLEKKEREIVFNIDKIFKDAIKTYEFTNMQTFKIGNDQDALEKAFHYIHSANKLYICSLQDELESICSEIRKLKK